MENGLLIFDEFNHEGTKPPRSKIGNIEHPRNTWEYGQLARVLRFAGWQPALQSVVMPAAAAVIATPPTATIAAAKSE